MGMDFNQIGSSKQPDRGSNWMPGHPDNTIGPGPGPVSGPPSFPGQAGPSVQPQRPPSVIILHIFSYPDMNDKRLDFLLDKSYLGNCAVDS